MVRTVGLPGLGDETEVGTERVKVEYEQDASIVVLPDTPKTYLVHPDNGLPWNLKGALELLGRLEMCSAPVSALTNLWRHYPNLHTSIEMEQFFSGSYRLPTPVFLAGLNEEWCTEDGEPVVHGFDPACWCWGRCGARGVPLVVIKIERYFDSAFWLVAHRATRR